MRTAPKPPGINYLNRGHPLARGLVLFDSCDGSIYGRDQINGVRGAATSSLFAGMGPLGSGICIPAAAGTSQRSPYTPPTWTGPYTIFSVQSHFTPATMQHIFGNDNGTTRRYQYRVNTSNGIDFIPFNTSSGVFANFSSSNTLGADRLAAGYVSAVAASATAAWIMLDGVITSAAGSGTLQNPVAGAMFSRDPGSTNNEASGKACIYLLAAWARTLTVAELMSLYADPWQLLEEAIDDDALTGGVAATTTPKLIGGNLIRPNLVRGRLAA